MTGIPDWVRWMMIASLMAEAVLLVKLAATGLARTYRWFSYFLVYDAFMTLLLVAALANEHDYARIWFYMQPISWIFSFAALLEIYSLVMGGYPGIAGMLRWAVILAAAISALFVLSHSLDLASPQYYFHFLRGVVPLHYMVTQVVAISMLVPCLFLLCFPVRLPRNAVVHALLFTAMVGGDAVHLLASRMHSAWLRPSEGLALAVGNLCLAGWIVLLGKKGEQVEVVPGLLRRQQSERLLLTHLMAVEQSLARVGSASR